MDGSNPRVCGGKFRAASGRPNCGRSQHRQLCFAAQGVPLATELEATIDTVALHAIQERVDDGTGRAPTANPSQTTLISAAAEFRITNYGATDTDEFLFLQS